MTFANEGIIYVGTTTKATATTISAPITGTGVSLTVDPFGGAASQLTLSKATGNTYSGTTTLATATAGAAGNGVLSIANNADLGSGTLVLDNGTLLSTTATTITNPVTLNGTPILGGTVALAFAGAVALAGNSTITNSNTAGVSFGAIGDGGNGYSLSFAGAQATTVLGAISGALTLNVSGAGTVTVGSSLNNYTGATTINAGTLLVNGGIAASATTVNSGATLAGTGTVGNVLVNNGGTLSPGSGAGNFGTLTAASVNLFGGGNLVIPLSGTVTGSYDALAVTGNLTLGGASILSLNLSGYSNAGSSNLTIAPITTGNQIGAFSDALPVPPATSANVSSADIFNNPNTYNVSASYAATSLQLTFTAATPLVTVGDAGGTFTGSTFPATALVAGASSLEGVAPTLAYYAGSAATGAPLPDAPSVAGTYTVVASFAGSADYTSATSSNVTFTITQATPMFTLSDAGGPYTGSAFPATVFINGNDNLEGVAPTLTYYAGSAATGSPLPTAPVL